MKYLIGIVGVIAALVGGFYALNAYIYNEKQGDGDNTQGVLPEVVPIMHASAALLWNGTIVYTDPTGGPEIYADMPAADIILVTDIHGDHLSTSTLAAVMTPHTSLVVPQAVRDLLPEDLSVRARVMKNGDSISEKGLSIEAIPMYNLPEATSSRHVKGRGNGYVLEKNSTRVYVAGDTAGTPEMRALTDIDVALIPMNPPFTMTVEEAADAVLAFKPKNVYPYHYRAQGGLSDVNLFKQLVDAGAAGVTVVLLDWYPTQ